MERLRSILEMQWWHKEKCNQMTIRCHCDLLDIASLSGNTQKVSLYNSTVFLI